MRCLSCDANLTDFETTRKTLGGVYLDLCNECFIAMDEDMPTLVREDLLTPNDFIEGFDYNE